MKLDGFERRLQRQPMRSVPEEWRNEILGTARRAGNPQPSTLEPRIVSSWSDLLWPCPQAWAGLAAVWAVILVLDMATHEPVQVVKVSKAAPAREILIALKEQRRLLAELIESPTAVEQPKPFEPRPRSEISSPTGTLQSA